LKVWRTLLGRHFIVSKKGECHGAKNTGTEDIVFVSIVAPVPADYDPVKTN